MRRFVSFTLFATCFVFVSAGLGVEGPSSAAAAGKPQPRLPAKRAKAKKKKKSVSTNGFVFRKLLPHYNTKDRLTLPVLGGYTSTVARLQRRVITETIVRPYRVSIVTGPPRTMHRWYTVRRQDRRISLRPPRKANQLFGVVLRDALTGAFLSGTTVSLELLDPKTKAQMSTQRLLLLWDGYPSYVGNIRLPKRKKVIVQVTVGAFPVTRTTRTLAAMRRSVLAKFPAAIKGGQLVFARRRLPINKSLIGQELLSALTAVNDQVLSMGVLYRVGIAFVRPAPVWRLKRNGIERVTPDPTINTRVLIFVQDRRSGLLIPDAQMKVFFYWKQHDGNYRIDREVKPLHDGFPGYYCDVTLKNYIFGVRVRVDAPAHFRFERELPVSYSFEFSGLKRPRVSRPAKKAKAPAKRR